MGAESAPPPNPVPEDQKKPGLNRVNRQLPGDVFDNNQRWHAINRDSKKLEKLRKGKPPESTSEMIQLLSEGDIDDIPVTNKSTSVRNPYKRLAFRDQAILALQ